MKCNIFSFLFLLMLTSSFCAEKKSDWEKFKLAAEKQLPKLFNSKDIKVLQFAHIGELIVQNKKYQIVYSKSVLTGMLSPRGKTIILFIDKDFKIVKHIETYGYIVPLWADKSKLYFFGSQSIYFVNNPEGKSGNVVDYKNGLNKGILMYEKNYGSSGGIRD